MTLTEQIAQMAAALPVDRQQEVLDFVEFLRSREAPVLPTARRAGGLFAGMPYFIADEFDEPLPDAFWVGDEP